MKIGVIGAAAWGTALANLRANNGLDVALGVFEQEVCAGRLEERENKVFLPGVALSQNIQPSNDLDCVAAIIEMLLLVVHSLVFS